MWDNIRRPNLQIIGIEEGEESQVYGLDQIFNKIIEENFPKLRKNIPIQTQTAQRTLNRQDQKRNWTHHSSNTK